MRNSNISNAAAKIETYVLPEDAVVGGSWNLPEHYIDTYDSINAPFWDIEEPEFVGFIKSVEKTDEDNILKVEYWIYRLNKAHCAGYYQHWSTGTAMVDIKTHRRWDVE